MMWRSESNLRQDDRRTGLWLELWQLKEQKEQTVTVKGSVNEAEELHEVGKPRKKQ